jgi:hypothetical protein
LDNSDNIFDFYETGDVLNMPPKQWLLKQIFGPEDIGMIYGPPGCGKTFLIIDLMIKLCRGKKWAFHFDVTRPLNVCYCAGEGHGGLGSRFQAAFKENNITELSTFTMTKTVPQLFDSSAPSFALQFITSWRKRQEFKRSKNLDLLIIDTFHSSIMRADENSAKDMGVIFKNCQLIAKSLGCAIIVVHHTNKGELIERGSTVFRASADFMLSVTKNNGEARYSTLHCSKNKDGIYFNPINFNLAEVEDTDSVSVAWDVDSIVEKTDKELKELALDAMIEFSDSKFSYSEIASIIEKDKKTTYRIINEMVKEKLIIKSLSDMSKKPSKNNVWLFSIKRKINYM